MSISQDFIQSQYQSHVYGKEKKMSYSKMKLHKPDDGTNVVLIVKSNTVVSAYTLYSHLPQYCSHPSNFCLEARLKTGVI